MSKKDHNSMGSFYWIFSATMMILLLMGTGVSATSWAEMEPKEVIDKAEIIVIGTYDFSSKPIQSDFVFQGRSFNAKSVYRGETTEQIIAGIDMYDVGWAEEFQDQGGEFLLFLEESEEADFLIPVGGPNGMIQIKNGKVGNLNAESSAFYEDILKEQPKDPSPEKNNLLVDEKKTKSYTPLYVSLAVLIVGVGAFLIYRNQRRK